ncbi:PAS domain-containing protein [Roseibacillus persicicus]|uniref:PAS domain-containing protein n=1 Tax=Roseibacillus persicicus TaxID=454148 RepID=UPI002810F33B|nr:PAS domain S-box protein [Roseibacillus persicicus]
MLSFGSNPSQDPIAGQAVSPSRPLENPSEVNLEYLVCSLGPSAKQNIAKLIELGPKFLHCQSVEIFTDQTGSTSPEADSETIVEPYGHSHKFLVIRTSNTSPDAGRLAAYKNLLNQQETRIRDVERMSSLKKYTKALFESCPDGILVTDESGYILDANRAMVMLTRMSREKLMGLRASKLTNAKGRSQVMKAIRYLKTNNRARFDCRIRFGSGNGVPTSISIRDFVFQGQGLLLATIRDLSYLEEEVNQCKTYEKSLSRSITNATDAFIRYDQFGRITEANPYTEVLTGHLVEHLVGKPVDDLLSNSSLKAFRKSVAQLQKTGYSTFFCEIAKPDGTKIPSRAALMQLEHEGEVFCRLFLQDLRSLSAEQG